MSLTPPGASTASFGTELKELDPRPLHDTSPHQDGPRTHSLFMGQPFATECRADGSALWRGVGTHLAVFWDIGVRLWGIQASFTYNTECYCFFYSRMERIESNPWR